MTTRYWVLGIGIFVFFFPKARSVSSSSPRISSLTSAPTNPRRLTPRKNSGIKFNAVSPYPHGGALIVGPNGSIARIP